MGHYPVINLSLKSKSQDIKIRYLIEINGKWKEFTNNNFTRAYRISTDYNLILRDSKLRAQANNEVLLVKNENNSIRDWFDFQ